MILLCEDDPQEALVRAYLNLCRFRTKPPTLRLRNMSREEQGGNVASVLREFSGELRACRSRSARAKTLLIVVVDADDATVDRRRAQLSADPPISPSDPLVVLIPKRHIETWIRAANGDAVDEVNDYHNPEPTGSEIRGAAGSIHGWARNSPAPGETCVPSLRASLPEWRKIG